MWLKRLLKYLLKPIINLFKAATWPMVAPMAVYFSAGVSAFTGIIEGFFVKESLTITVVGLASLGFWAGLPWALKMAVGEMIDRHWNQKSIFVYTGAGIMALSLLIMVGLTGHLEWMAKITHPNIWYIISVLLAPIGYVLQDCCADAMTVDAVPNEGTAQEIQSAHTTMQSLGRLAVLGGGVLVAGAGGWLAEIYSYHTMYIVSLIIPIVSVLGVIIARGRGRTAAVPAGKQQVNLQVIWGSVAFMAVALIFGLTGWIYKEEAVFLFSLAILVYLIRGLIKDLPDAQRREIIAITAIIFVFRAMPGFGAGLTWWEIDSLGFDESFFGTLRQTGGMVAIVGLIMLRSWMAKREVPYLIVVLSIYAALMVLPFIGMAYGLHVWTMQHLGFGAKTLAIIDTFMDSPLSQVAMVPMLAFIARTSPKGSKAVWFATFAALSNLALSLSQIGTKYLNQIFIIERGSYSQVGPLLITASAIGLVLPITAVFAIRYRRKR